MHGTISLVLCLVLIKEHGTQCPGVKIDSGFLQQPLGMKRAQVREQRAIPGNPLVNQQHAHRLQGW